MRDIHTRPREHSLATVSAGFGFGFSEHRLLAAVNRCGKIHVTALVGFRAGDSVRRNCLLRFSSYICESAIRSN